jgi:broad specificity phosphatase PhoE
MARRLLLLRHGRTAWNAVGRAQGHADVPLDSTGLDGARAAAAHLATSRDLAALWSSDLLRARQTAACVAEATGLPVKHDERLREFHVGRREGLTLEEFADQHPDAHAEWLRARGGAADRAPAAGVPDVAPRR